MTKLSDYIESERLKSIKNEEDAKRLRIMDNIKKDTFKDKFVSYVLEDLLYQLLKLQSTNRDFYVTEQERRIDSEPYLLEFEINLTINNQVAQYFLSFLGNYQANPNGISITLQNAGTSSKNIDLDFDEIDSLNFEDLLVTLLSQVNGS